MKIRTVGVLTLSVILGIFANEVSGKVSRSDKGHGVVETGLTPVYPDDYDCSPLTSLYASWIDVDGSKRTERHSGVDGGRFGEKIFAPASGIVKSAWKANWGWGEEGALLIRHTREDLGLTSGPKYYYSEFDHLNYQDIKSLAEGDKIKRGASFATVSTPGGKSRYLPEVHWEVWEIEDDDATVWGVNRHNGRYWTNASGRLVDPLYLLSRDSTPDELGQFSIPIFDKKKDYSKFKGFTYILPCAKRRTSR